MNQRLTQQQWLEGGLDALAKLGPGALKIGFLASRLGVTRGSFYWHFKDLEDYRQQLLERWRSLSTEQIIARLEEQQQGTDRLAALLRRAFLGPRPLERTLRAWAIEDPSVRQIIGEVDEKRIGYVADLLRAAGVNPQAIGYRARFLYWAYLGQSIAPDDAPTGIEAEELDAIGDLFLR